MNNVSELQQKNMDNIRKFYQKVVKADEFIRKLSMYKQMGRLNPNQIKEFEKQIGDIIQYLEKTYKGNKTISLNIELNNSFMDLMMLWNAYKSGLPIKSREAEDLEAENLLNNIMGDYNRQQYGGK